MPVQDHIHTTLDVCGDMVVSGSRGTEGNGAVVAVSRIGVWIVVGLNCDVSGLIAEKSEYSVYSVRYSERYLVVVKYMDIIISELYGNLGDVYLV